MNAVEIEEAVSALMAEPFNRAEFPYQFLAAFGFKDTTIRKLRAGATSTSDVPGAVLLRSNIHLAVTEPGNTSEAIKALKASPKTAKGKVKFLLATDGAMVEAEELATGDIRACPYVEVPKHFGFFLPLAGISTVAEIKDNPVDIKATGRLNKLYVQLLKDNEDWSTDAKRPALNQFLARLIFCFFAEDTDIFPGEGLFTQCLQQMTDPQSTNTDEVINELFRAMNTPPDKRKSAGIKNWADVFPYVNGGLFANDIGCPHFSRVARSYLLRVGELSWKEINPDIFGSMIQAVADDDERGSLGMHYTSVPNILKVLDPLFLDDLRQQLDEASDKPIKLLNLRKRLANIRVFDPACGSGNFLVISYIEMRKIEAEIIRRRKDPDNKSWIKLTNFHGIEIKSFPAEIARLALLIAEFQCNVRFIGQREACLDVLPLHDTGRIVTGNALRLDWAKVCPPAPSPGLVEEDLAGPTGRLALGGDVAEAETYICGNPPYAGDKKQTDLQKDDMNHVFGEVTDRWRSFDYVCGFFYKGSKFLGTPTKARVAFVSTNSVTQGVQVAHFWPLAQNTAKIGFSHASFKWSNLAARNAGVVCVIIGLARADSSRPTIIFDGDMARAVPSITPYLTSGTTVLVDVRPEPLSALSPMMLGNFAKDGGHLLLTVAERWSLDASILKYVRPIYGAQEFIKGVQRYCLWIGDNEVEAASAHQEVAERLKRVAEFRMKSKKSATVAWSDRPHRFVEIRWPRCTNAILVPRVSSEGREYLPTGLLPPLSIVTEAFGLYDAPLWNMALVASKLHLVWIATVCGKMKTDFRYSNTLGWNTFPVPKLTEHDKANLTRCAEDILLAREAHFPKTIADLYEPEKMPDDLRAAHERNDETLERIYIGRKFKNDTERLEKLFDMYTKMIKDEEARTVRAAPRNGRRARNGNGARTGEHA